jgi:hypothetical protein
VPFFVDELAGVAAADSPALRMGVRVGAAYAIVKRQLRHANAGGAVPRLPAWLRARDRLEKFATRTYGIRWWFHGDR